MANEGYDVYIGNNRGTEYSAGHQSLVYDTAEYWDFTVDGYAEDVRANMKAMYENSGNKKGFYFGYALGTIEMLVSLSTFEEELKDYLEKVTLLAPCLFIAKVFQPFPPSYDMGELAKAEIYAYNSPSWSPEKICANSTDENICAAATR